MAPSHRTRLYLLVLAAILLAGGKGAGAQDLEVGAQVGARTGGSFSDPATNRDQVLEPAISFGLLVEVPVLGPGRFVQLLWSRQESTLDLATQGPVDVTVDYLHCGGAYRWRNEQPVSPYVAAGVGITLLGGDSGSGTTVEPSGSLALGFRWAATQRLGIRLEGRGYGTFSVSGGGLYCGGGCTATLSAGGMFQIEGSAALSLVF